MKKLLQIAFILTVTVTVLKAQQEKVAVLNIDVQGMDYDKAAMGNLVRLELEKKGVYRVMDKYDTQFILKQNGFDGSECYGKICLVEAGKILEADKLISGSVEKIDDKIIIILRLINVKLNMIEKADIMEYIDAPEIQRMLSISLNNILGIPNDQVIVDQITNLNDPINTPKSQLCLNGPRMGLSYIGGLNGEIVQNSIDNGGFNALPISTLIGYQQEVSYLSSGNFQALVEFIPMIGGLEQSRFVPSLVFLNGIRSNKSGIEVAFGPVFEISKIARGFYIKDEWYLEDDAPLFEETNDIIIEKRLDSRAEIPTLTTSWVWAFGKTFKSGYINIPVNLYFSLKKNGWVVGTSFGFNISKF